MKELSIKADSFGPDAIVAIARGGLCIGQFLAESLDLRALYSINSIHYDDDKKLDYIELFNIPDLKDAVNVLVVDDIVDSGDTMVEVLKVLKKKYPKVNFKVMTIFQKNRAKLHADFWAQKNEEWIDFFWTRDIKKL